MTTQPCPKCHCLMENIKPRNAYTLRWKCERCRFTMETHATNKIFPETHVPSSWSNNVQRGA